MPFDSSSRNIGTTIGEKVATLREFIAHEMETRSQRGLHAAEACYLVIARTPDSPVAQALRAHAANLSSAGIRVRAIFSEVEPGREASATLTAPFAMPSECRLARDPRLLAAHEQLVLAPDCAWIGDCMRREPSKRDTFERYALNCMETAAHATRSFERLWRIAAPIQTLVPLSAALASRVPKAAGHATARSESTRRQ